MVSAPSPLLSSRVLVLGKIESTYNVDASPSPSSDALLVIDADVRIEPNVLERQFARPSLSPAATSLGRKLVTMTFSHELKGSGTVGTPGKIGTLLRACGFAQTVIANSAAATISAITAGSANAGATVSWAKDVASTKTGRYRVTCTKGGASATAEMRVSGIPAPGDDTILKNETFSASVSSGATMTLTQGLTSASDYSSITYTVAGTFNAGDVLTAVVGGIEFNYTVVSGDTDNDGAATSLAALIDAHALLSASASSGVVTVTFAGLADPVVVTSGTTAINIGDSNADITPTWTGTLTVGDYWDILVLEPGVHYTPVSTGFESATLYMYLDGLLHKSTGCMGTVTFSGEGGDFGTAQFTFTGQFIAVTDATFPTGVVYESTVPDQIELAGLALNGNDDFCAQSFTIDLQNTVTPRDCINNSDGFNGVQITARAPQGTINPETQLEANHPFWEILSNSTQIPFHVKVGNTAGNQIRFIGDAVQYSNITYAERNGFRVSDTSIRFSQYSGDGDDELRLVFS